MIQELNDCLRERRDAAYRLLRLFAQRNEAFMLRSTLTETFTAFAENEEKEGRTLAETPLADAFIFSQEAACVTPWLYLAVRPKPARWNYLRFHIEDLRAEELDVREYLAFREGIASGGSDSSQDWMLEIDLGPFNRGFPKLTEARSIGRGVEFLNRNLSGRILSDGERGANSLFKFLKLHHVRGVQLMLNRVIENPAGLRAALHRADEYLGRQPAERLWPEVARPLQQMGFEPGWGNNVSRIRETMRLLIDIFEAPDHERVEKFLDRIPMIFGIAIISPHGFFGQAGVLGLPDTGGQVVYILDQVRALEAEMIRRVEAQGVGGLGIVPRIVVVTRLIPESQGTSCNQPREKILGTNNAWILRVPFRGEGGEVLPHWISRFVVWPYLERFAVEAESELVRELDGRPDLIIGNYSDGNLVASLMSQRMHVTQCNIAHALEKTKYLYSALYWREMEDQYHFSCQFTADLIAMNTADFIIASTYQEIAGNEDSVGQYESYSSFTMPGLYRVIDGVDVFDPKFNIVSPGADADVYFPYTETSQRLVGLKDELHEMIFGVARENARGHLERPDLPILFALSRLDKIKNVTGLVEWYARSPRLREMANLVIVAGASTDPNQSGDDEERHAIGHLHDIMNEHHLDGHMRWIAGRLDKNLSGELYRTIANHRGVFVQPALFEAFGLTVIEAMASGLPTFATCYGGPLEIIENGISGFHIDPNHGDAATDLLADFLQRCAKEPGYWEKISQQSIDRVLERYTWKLYAQRLMTLSRVYGFWKYVTNLERAETRRYLEMLYGLQFRPRAAMIQS